MAKHAQGGLESITKPIVLLEANESESEGEEGEMDVGAAFVSDGEAAELVEPGVCAFDGPAVLAVCLTAFDAAPCDAMLDTSAGAPKGITPCAQPRTAPERASSIG